MEGVRSGRTIKEGWPFPCMKARFLQEKRPWRFPSGCSPRPGGRSAHRGLHTIHGALGSGGRGATLADVDSKSCETDRLRAKAGFIILRPRRPLRELRSEPGAFIGSVPPRGGAAAAGLRAAHVRGRAGINHVAPMAWQRGDRRDDIRTGTRPRTASAPTASRARAASCTASRAWILSISRRRMIRRTC